MGHFQNDWVIDVWGQCKKKWQTDNEERERMKNRTGSVLGVCSIFLTQFVFMVEGIQYAPWHDLPGITTEHPAWSFWIHLITLQVEIIHSSYSVHNLKWISAHEICVVSFCHEWSVITQCLGWGLNRSWGSQAETAESMIKSYIQSVWCDRGHN